MALSKVNLTEADLASILSGNPGQLDIHLALVERDVEIAGCETRVHCHCLMVDANGNVKISRLAEYLRSVITDYAIPRSKVNEARERDLREKTTAAVTALHYEARGLFTEIANSGEGGEILLYCLASHFLKLPQVLCKMDLKTNSSMHYHGADGVYASVADDGVLKLFWGESKVHATAKSAISECLKSLAPFLLDEESEHSGRERDLILLSDKADLEDPQITAAFRRYFDKTSPQSNRVRYCGIALAAFDVDFYSPNGACVLENIIEDARSALATWKSELATRIPNHKLEKVEIHAFCLPLPSVDAFRKAFFQALGID